MELAKFTKSTHQKDQLLDSNNYCYDLRSASVDELLLYFEAYCYLLGKCIFVISNLLEKNLQTKFLEAQFLGVNSF